MTMVPLSLVDVLINRVNVDNTADLGMKPTWQHAWLKDGRDVEDILTAQPPLTRAAMKRAIKMVDYLEVVT